MKDFQRSLLQNAVPLAAPPLPPLRLLPAPLAIRQSGGFTPSLIHKGNATIVKNAVAAPLVLVPTHSIVLMLKSRLHSLRRLSHPTISLQRLEPLPLRVPANLLKVLQAVRPVRHQWPR
jgi:hypothetical protein